MPERACVRCRTPETDIIEPYWIDGKPFFEDEGKLYCLYCAQEVVPPGFFKSKPRPEEGMYTAVVDGSVTSVESETSLLEVPDACADCHTPLEVDDGREFFFVDLTATTAVCYCSKCRDQQGFPLQSAQDCRV